MGSSISIFNDILGPIMRGPSSSHTAGSYNIAKIIRYLSFQKIVSVNITFDPAGSFAPTYKILGVDKAFASGLLGLSLIDKDFFNSLDICQENNLQLNFEIDKIQVNHHPNTAKINIKYIDGKSLDILAEAIGGGGINIKTINGWKVNINGLENKVLIQTDAENKNNVIDVSNSLGIKQHTIESKDDKILIDLALEKALNEKQLSRITRLNNSIEVWQIIPVFYSIKGKSLFANSFDLIEQARKYGNSIGQAGLKYEMELLGLTMEKAVEEMDKRLTIMLDSVTKGLDEKNISMVLTDPSAAGILKAEAKSSLAIGGIHTRAAARAMATMHIDNSMGVICAAPTGGSSGVIPGIIYTLIEEHTINRSKAIDILFAASAIGVIIAKRATFSAELAGCQVEIGASGAMAAAMIVEYASGTTKQAVDAAAIALQNIIGSVCDTVQGGCEIPCHTRNALAVSNAFLCADLILGGYNNLIPLDETIDAMTEVAKAMPKELRCTSKGGLAVTPSALKIKQKKPNRKQ